MMNQLNRRHFIECATASAVALAFRADCAQEKSAKPVPFRTIYSNDTTHILSCQRPETRSEFTDALLRRSITEAGDADAHFLQPGLGWIPWWNSDIYSVEDHYRWLRDTFNIKGVRKIDRYLLSGGDMLQTLVETCQKIKVAPFLSFRLNDGHHVRDLQQALQRGKPTQNMARHYWENCLKFRIGEDSADWDAGVFDWSIPEVRNYKFALIEEACATYDLAGLELDFLRHWVRFGPQCPLEERSTITTDFVRRVRRMLDKTAVDRGLPRRWLCVRVPASSKIRPEQGINLAELTRAGVDMINLSHSYFTWQDDEVHRAREEVRDKAAVYLEMTHTTMTGKASAGSGTQPFLRTTDEQFYTTARLARQQGAHGVSLFNFPYYRYHVTETIGPFHEPPFHVLPKLTDDEFLNSQPQWYFLSSGRNDPVLGKKALPAILKRDQPHTLSMAMMPTKERHANGLLRLRSNESISDRTIDVYFNNVKLNTAETVIMPLPHRYKDTWLGKPEELECFTLPSDTPVAAVNDVKIVVRKGIRVRLTYLDVTLS